MLGYLGLCCVLALQVYLLHNNLLGSVHTTLLLHKLQDIAVTPLPILEALWRPPQ